jgi:hypothetical protein
MLQFEVISAKEETKIATAFIRLSFKNLFVKIVSKLHARYGSHCGDCAIGLLRKARGLSFRARSRP